MMGEVSESITDMTIKGANMDEIAREVKHSMVVIDSEKHQVSITKGLMKRMLYHLFVKAIRVRKVEALLH